MISACVDRIDFNVPAANLQLVVEGKITDQPGPYTVKVSNALDLNSTEATPPPVTGAKITLLDDEGNSETFVEDLPGLYITSGIIRGKIGHAYSIRMETLEGNIFESEPDTIFPGGEIQDIRYEFEARTQKQSFGETEADVFNIYLDSYGGERENNFLRWQYLGTYEVQTNPELHEIFLQVSSYKDPLPCSGYIITPALGGGKLEKVSECECCTCWVNEYEKIPLLSDAELVINNQFNNIKIAEVPINPATFYKKFSVLIEEMSLSRTAFEFFKLVRAQKVGASSIFQPPSGEIRGNIKAINSNQPVVGIFWATSISRKQIFIPRAAVPYELPPIYFVPDACNKHYPNSSTTKPAFWE
jgi:hypothetical protein